MIRWILLKLNAGRYISLLYYLLKCYLYNQQTVVWCVLCIIIKKFPHPIKRMKKKKLFFYCSPLPFTRTIRMLNCLGLECIKKKKPIDPL